MKRYLVFAGEIYHAEGGWEDLKGQADTALEARNLADMKDGDTGYYAHSWAQIVDTATGEIIAKRCGSEVGFDEWEKP